MKRILIVTTPVMLFVLLALGVPSSVAEKPQKAIERKMFGIGVIAGEPTGITGKYMIDNNSAIDAGVGWETSGDNEFHSRVAQGNLTPTLPQIRA